MYRHIFAATVLALGGFGLSGCRDRGDSEADRISRDVSERVETSPAFARSLGERPRVTRSRCRPGAPGHRNAHFRGARVYLCDVALDDGSSIDVCAARVRGRVYTHVETPKIPCVPRFS